MNQMRVQDAFGLRQVDHIVRASPKIGTTQYEALYSDYAYR